MMKRTKVLSRLLLSVVTLFALGISSGIAQTSGDNQRVVSNYNQQYPNNAAISATNLTGGTLTQPNSLSSIVSLGSSGFYLNGRKYTHIRIASNGFVALGTSSNASDFAGLTASGDNTRIRQFDADPSASNIMNPIIASLWDDFQFNAQSVVSWANTATEFRVIWRGVVWNGRSMTFQLTLTYNGNIVETQYSSPGASQQTESATVGIFDPTTSAGNRSMLLGFDNTRTFVVYGTADNTALNVTEIDSEFLDTELFNFAPAANAVQLGHYDAVVVDNPNNTIDIGDAVARTEKTQTVTLRNVGANAVTVFTSDFTTSASVAADDFVFSVVGATSTTVAANGTQTMQIAYNADCSNPALANTNTVAIGTIDYDVNNTNGARVIFPANGTLNVQGNPIAPNVTAVAVGNTNFAQNIVAGQTVTQVFTISNAAGTSVFNGTVDLFTNNTTLPASDFSLSPVSGSTISIPAGGSTTVILTVTPSLTSHAAQANASWNADYGQLFVDVTPTNQPCSNNNLISSAAIPTSSVAPRLQFFTFNAGVNAVDLGELTYDSQVKEEVNATNLLNKTEILTVRNTGSSTVTFDLADMVSAGTTTLRDNFTIAPTSVVTLAANAAQNFTITYTPSGTTDDYNYPATATAPTTRAAAKNINAEWNVTTAPNINGQAGYWVNNQGQNLVNNTKVVSNIAIIRGYLQTAITASADYSDRPRLVGTNIATGAANPAQNANAIAMTATWGATNDMLPSGSRIQAMGTKDTTRFYLINNGNAASDFYVPTSLGSNAAFTYLSAAATSTATQTANVTINGTAYTRFSLDPIAERQNDEWRSAVLIQVVFNPNASNFTLPANLNDATAMRTTATLNILTDAAPSTGNDANVLTTQTISLTGNVQTVDPVLQYQMNGSFVDITNANATVDFGIHELAAERSGAANGVRDTIINFRLVNRGNQAIRFSTTGTNDFSNLVASAVAGQSLDFDFSVSSLPSPFNVNGNNGSAVIPVRFDAGDRNNAATRTGQGAYGLTVVSSSATTGYASAQVTWNFRAVGTGIRPFPITPTGNFQMRDAFAGVNRNLSEAQALPIILDNYCGTLTTSNMEFRDVQIQFANGNPNPTAVGHANNEVTPITLNLNPQTLRIYDMNFVGGVDQLNDTSTVSTSFTILESAGARRSDGTTFSFINSSTTVTLSAGQTVTLTVRYRPTGTQLGFETALVRLNHMVSRNNNEDYPQDRAASHTNNSGEFGDVYKYLDYVVSGSKERKAFRLEYLTNNNYVATNDTITAFNLNYPSKDGIFVGDSNFVALRLRPSASMSSPFNANDVADQAVNRIRVRSISIQGADAADFEIVGFDLPATQTTPILSRFPLRRPGATFPMVTNTQNSGGAASMLSWENAPTSDLTLFRNPAGNQRGDVSLYVHFKPRKMINGAIDTNIRNAQLVVVTDDACLGQNGTVSYALSGRPLVANVVASNDELNFGRVQLNDVATDTVTITNNGNYPAYFRNRFADNPNGFPPFPTPLDIPFQTFNPNSPFYLHNFSLIPVGFELVNPRDLYVVGDTTTALQPGEQRKIEVKYAPTSLVAINAELIGRFLPDVDSRRTDNQIKVAIKGRAITTMVVGDLAITPGTVDFDSTAVGSTDSVHVRVQNNGTSSVTLDLPANQTVITHNLPGASATLAPGQSATVVFTFAPTAVGTFERDYAIVVKGLVGGDETVVLKTMGVATSPVAIASPVGTQLLDFGTVRVFANEVRNFRITNNGVGTLTVTSVKVVGADSTSYEVVNAPATVTAGMSADVNVRFSPEVLPSDPTQTVPATRATIEVEYTAPFITGTGKAMITLNGQGGVPQIAFEETQDGNPNDARLSFFNGERDRAVTIRNIGTVALEVNQIQVVGENASLFTLNAPAGSTVLQASASFDVSLTLNCGSNTTATVSNTRLIALSNTQNQRFLEIEGSCAAPALMMSASSMNFGTARVNQVVDKTVIITNTTGAPIQVNEVTLGGMNSDNYTVVGTSKNLPATLAADEALTIVLQFKPTTSGDKSARLFVATSIEQAEVQLFGRSVEAGVAMNAQQYNFGGVSVGSSKTVEVMVSNTGTTPIQLTEAIFNGQNEAEFSANVNNIVIPEGQTQAIPVIFAPTSNGMKSAVMTIVNDVDAPLQAIVMGNGGSAVLNVAPKLDFGTGVVNNMRERAITLANTGDADLVVENMLIGGEDFSDFLLVTQAPLTIQPGRTENVVVRFKPTVVGQKNATLTVMYNDEQDEVIELQGESTPVSVEEGSAYSVAVQVAPNPIVDNATITYTVADNAEVTISVVDQRGAVVATLLANQTKSTGVHTLPWNVSDVASGTYYVQLTSGDTTVIQTITVVK